VGEVFAVRASLLLLDPLTVVASFGLGVGVGEVFAVRASALLFDPLTVTASFGLGVGVALSGYKTSCLRFDTLTFALGVGVGVGAAVRSDTLLFVDLILTVAFGLGVGVGLSVAVRLSALLLDELVVVAAFVVTRPANVVSTATLIISVSNFLFMVGTPLEFPNWLNTTPHVPFPLGFPFISFWMNS